jgi:HlyD family secretion protein
MPLSNTSYGSGPRRQWWIWIVVLVAAVLLLASFMSRGDAVPVRAAEALRSNIRSAVSTNGKVEPLTQFEAHSPIATMVRKLLVKEGDHVKRGQMLVLMDDAEARSAAARALTQIRAAQADLDAVHTGGNQEEILTLDSDLAKARVARDTAQRNLDALTKLEAEGAASAGEVKAANDQLQNANADYALLQQKQRERYSKPEIEKVEAQTSAAQAAYAAAEDTLRQLNIQAPFDGVVYSLPVMQGAYVNAGDLILEEADLSKIRVRAFVDEPDVGRLATGDPIEVTWDAMPGRVWQSTVTSLPTVIKLHNTRNVGETTFIVDNQDLKLLPNINVGVTIVTAEHHNVVTVPREAVHQEDSQKYVYQIIDNELHRREVQTSLSNLTQVELTGGLPEKAEVALSPLNTKPLHDGLAVKVVR